MLDGLLGRGFSPKCKSLIKATKSRIEVLRRRAEAKQRFLKEDLAKLLANGLDINAFGRTEEFLAGMCLLSCYDFIEYSCEYLLKHLSIMQKQRECPEEFREPVSSLMFAAARFSDLPELRDLRDTFQERYGDSLEYFANHVDQPRKYGPSPVNDDKYKLSNGKGNGSSNGNGHKPLSSNAETRDTNEISFRGRREFSHGSLNEKDTSPKAVRSGSSSSRGNRSESFEGTRSKRGTLPNGVREDPLSRGKGLEYGGYTVHRDRSNTAPKFEKDPVSHGKGSDHVGNGYPTTLNGWVTTPKGETKDTLSSGKGSDHVDGGYPTALSDWGATPKRETEDPTSRGKGSDLVDGEYPMALNNWCTTAKRETKDPLSRAKGSDCVNGGYPTAVNDWATVFKGESKDPLPLGKGSERIDGGYPTLIDGATVPKVEKDPSQQSYYNNALPPPYVKLKDSANPPYVKPKGSSYGTRTDSEQAGLDSAESSMDPTPRSRAKQVMSSDKIQKEPPDHQNHILLPKPRSVRRKHSKSSSSNHEDIINPKDGHVVRRTSSSRRKEHSKKGLQILFDDEHYQKDEEERMMDKLLLHYSKKSSNYDITKLRKKSEVDRIVGQEKPEIAPTRSISLPREPTGPLEGPKVFARANSFHPDTQAPHVHPKLPDYDDLAARFAALRGR
ncbi:hypothetical protein LguiB_011693 [Lonicera macranthoides]